MACSSSPPSAQPASVRPEPPSGVPGAVEPPPSVDWTPLAATIEAERRKRGVPGVAVVVVHHGEVVFSEGFGTRPDGDEAIFTSTLFRVSSVAKTWTAMAIMRLIEQGRLALDTKIVDVLPTFTLQGNPPETSQLTVRHLLTHRSGIYDGGADGSSANPNDDGFLERWILGTEFAASRYFMVPPDRTFNYANVNFAILGLVAEKVSGKRYRALLADSVWGPLGMSRVRCTPEEIRADGDFTTGKGEARTIVPEDDFTPAGWPSGGGAGCHVSADDLAKLARALLDGGPNVIAPPALAAMTEGHTTTGTAWIESMYHAQRYGFGTFSYDGVAIGGQYHPLRVVGHEGTGRGYTSLMFAVPERQLAFVALSNGADGYFDDTFARVVELAGLPRATARPPSGVDAAKYPRFVGSYVEPKRLKEVTVRQVGDKLYADISGLSISGRELTPDHGERFGLLDVKTEVGHYDRYVRFVEDESGKVELITNRFWVARRLEVSQ